MGEGKLVPKRRFKGFSECWRPEKIVDVLEVNSGRDYKHLKKGTVPVYGTGGYMLSVNDNLSTKDGVGIGRKGTIDNPQYLRAPFWTVDTLFFMIPKVNFNLLFFFSKSKNIRWKELDESSGVPSLSKNTIDNIEIYIPLEKEQQKIGNFFKVLDERIANQEQNIAKVKALKSAYLTEMFPQEDETVPKRRFKGFEGKWLLVSVKDIGNSYYGGGTPNTSISKYWNGNIPWIQSSDLNEYFINMKHPRKSITRLGLQKSATKLVPADSIAVVTRVGVGKVVFIPYEYTTSQDFLSISNLNVDFIFGTYSLHQLLQKEKESVQGTSIKGMTKSELLSLRLLIPSDINEQQKIGTFFKNLDNQITTEESKLEKLKRMKDAYLEEMFV